MTTLQPIIIRITAAIPLFCGIWAGIAPSAHAHRITVFAWVEGDRVHTESKFAGGKPVSGGKIVVLDSTGQQLLAGTTDTKGQFSFTAPQQPPFTIESHAGAGHKGHWMVTAEDMKDHALHSHATIPAPPKTASTDSPEVQTLTAQDIEAIVAKTLDQKLAPIHKAIVRQEQMEKNSVRDIFAGLGYILGLVGVGAYAHYRKRSTASK